VLKQQQSNIKLFSGEHEIVIRVNVLMLIKLKKRVI